MYTYTYEFGLKRQRTFRYQRWTVCLLRSSLEASIWRVFLERFALCAQLLILCEELPPSHIKGAHLCHQRLEVVAVVVAVRDRVHAAAPPRDEIVERRVRAPARDQAVAGPDQQVRDVREEAVDSLSDYQIGGRDGVVVRERQPQFVRLWVAILPDVGRSGLHRCHGGRRRPARGHGAGGRCCARSNH